MFVKLNVLVFVLVLNFKSMHACIGNTTQQPELWHRASKANAFFLMVAKDESVPYRKVSTFLQGKKLIFVCVYECIITCAELIYAWDPIYVSVKS